MSDLYKQKNLQDQELRKSFEEVTSHEMRSVFNMRDINKFGFSQEEAEYQSLDKTREETVKISQFLNKADEINLTEEDKDDLILRDNRNKNLLLLNNERSGGDSDFMTHVKEAISAYETEIKYGYQAYVDGTLETVDLNTQIETAIRKAETAIKRCSDYLGRGKPFFFWRRGRYNMVKDALGRLEKEKENLEKMKKTGTDIDLAGAVNEGENLLSVMNKSKLEKRVDSLRSRKQKEKEEKEEDKRNNIEYEGINKNQYEDMKKEYEERRRKEKEEREQWEKEHGIKHEEEEKDLKAIKKEYNKLNQDLDKIIKGEMFENMNLSFEEKQEKIKNVVLNLKTEKPLTKQQMWAEYQVRAASYNMSEEEIKRWRDEFLGPDYRFEEEEEEKKEEEEEEKPQTLEEQWEELKALAEKRGMTGKEILNWKNDFFAEARKQEHIERERKAAASGGARFGETLKDKVEGKAPIDDIDAKMSKRKERIEKEEKEKAEKERLEREQREKEEENNEEEERPMTIKEKWDDLVKTAKEMGMTGKEILNWRNDFFADYVEEVKTEQGPQTLEEKWEELAKTAKEMGMTGKEILNWEKDFFAEAKKQENIEKERKAAASGGARVGEAMNDKVKGKTPTDDIDAKMSKRKERIEKEEKEKAEKERLEKERIEKERLEKERIEKERKAAASGGARVGDAMNDKVKGKAPTDEIDKKMSKRKEDIQKAEKEKAEKERLKKEKAEKEKAEKERLEKEKAEKEKLEKEKAEKERLEKEKAGKAEKERQEKAKKEKDEKKPVNAKAEKERLEKEKAEKKRLEKERIEKEKAEKKRLEKERIEKEKAEKKRLEKERAEKAKAEKAKKAQEAAEKKDRELRAKKAKQAAEQREKVAKTGMKETTKILLAIKTEEVKVSEKQTDEQMKILSQFKENFTKVLEKKPVKEQAKDIARILDSFYKKQRSTDKWGDCSEEEALLKQYMEKKGSAEFIAEAKALYSEYEKQIENEYRDYVNRDIPENLLKKKGYANDPKAHFEAATLCMGRTEAFRRISGLKKMLGLLGVENEAIPAGFGTLLVEKSENAKYKYLNPEAVEKMHSIQDTFRQKSADCCLANYADPELLKVERKPVTEKDLDDSLKRIIGDWNSGKMTQPVDYEKLPTYEQAVKEQAALEKEYGKLDLKTIAIQRGLANIQVEHNKVIANNYKTLMMVPKDVSDRQDIDNRCTGTLRELLNGDMDCFMAFVYGEPDMMTQYMDSAMRTFLSSSVIKGNYSIDNYAVDTMSMYLSNGLAVYLDEYISRAKTKGYFENMGETAKDKVFALMRLVALNNTILASSARVAGFNPAQGDARFKQEKLRDTQEDFEDNKEAMEMMIEQKIKEVVGKFPDLFTEEQKKQWK